MRRTILLTGAVCACMLGQRIDYRVYNPPQPVERKQGQWFTDPAFGSRLFRLTDRSWADERCNIQGAYGYFPTFNSNSTRLAVDCQTSRGPKTYIVSWTPDTPPYYRITDETTTRFDEARANNGYWSRADPDVFRFFNYGNVLSSYNARTKSLRTVRRVREIDTELYAPKFFFVANDDNTFIVTLHRKSNGEGVGYFVARLTPWQVLRVDTTLRDTLQCQISGDGQWILRVDTKSRHHFIRVSDGFTRATTSAGHRGVGTKALTWHHAVDANHWYIKRWDFGVDTSEAIMSANGPRADDFSWIANDSTWAVFSHFTSGISNGSCSGIAFCKEVFSLKMDGSGQVKRWAHHHSAGIDFRDEPYPSQSYDNRFIAYQTNNGVPGARMDVYIIDAR